MIEMHGDESRPELVLELKGKLEHADYTELVPRLEAWLAEHGPIRCLIDMRGFQGIEVRAFLDELRFDLRHARDIERCAVLGDHRWEAWMSRLSKAFFRSADVRYFDAEQEDAALEWLREGSAADPSAENG